MIERRTRFVEIPRLGQNGGCLYAVELQNGWVKVGRSANPRSRMSSLGQNIWRHFRESIARYHIGPDIGWRMACAAERDLICRVRESGGRPTVIGECFSGVPFDAAVQLVAEVSKP